MRTVQCCIGGLAGNDLPVLTQIQVRIRAVGVPPVPPLLSTWSLRADASPFLMTRAYTKLDHRSIASLNLVK